MDMVIRPSPTPPGPLNVQVPRTSHLSSKWRGWERGLVFQGLVPIPLWPGGALELGREAGKEWECTVLISEVRWNWELRGAKLEAPQLPQTQDSYTYL